MITASGERISVEQDGPGFRIAEGVDLEVNVCPGRDLPEAAAGATPTPGSAIGPDASAFFGTVYSPTAPGRPAAGYHAVFADAITGVELRSEPTGPDGRYVLAVLPGTRYVPVAAEGSDGIRYVLDEGIGGFRLAAGQRLEFNFVSYR